MESVTVTAGSEFAWPAAVDASCNDAVFVHDRQFCIVYANNAYTGLAGMPLTEIIGNPYWDVFPKVNGPLFASGFRVSQPPDSETVEELRLESGQIFQSKSIPLFDHTGSYLASVHILKDVTTHRQEEVKSSNGHPNDPARPRLISEARTVEANDPSPNTVAIRPDVIQPNHGKHSLECMDRMYGISSSCSHHLIHAKTEHDLAQAFCDTLIERGGYCMAWVGNVEHNEDHSMKPLAHAGMEEGYLASFQLTWANTEGGSEPWGLCIRHGTVDGIMAQRGNKARLCLFYCTTTDEPPRNIRHFMLVFIRKYCFGRH
jgi:PAS fold